MFDFFNDLFAESKKSSYRYQVDSGRQIVVEGYKNILKIDDTSVALKLFDGEMEIEGRGLKVKEFCASTIIICGKIKCVKVEGDSHEK